MGKLVLQLLTEVGRKALYARRARLPEPADHVDDVGTSRWLWAGNFNDLAWGNRILFFWAVQVSGPASYCHLICSRRYNQGGISQLLPWFTVDDYICPRRL